MKVKQAQIMLSRLSNALAIGDKSSRLSEDKKKILSTAIGKIRELIGEAEIPQDNDIQKAEELLLELEKA